MPIKGVLSIRPTYARGATGEDVLRHSRGFITSHLPQNAVVMIHRRCQRLISLCVCRVCMYVRQKSSYVKSRTLLQIFSRHTRLVARRGEINEYVFSSTSVSLRLLLRSYFNVERFLMCYLLHYASLFLEYVKYSFLI